MSQMAPIKLRWIPYRWIQCGVPKSGWTSPRSGPTGVRTAPLQWGVTIIIETTTPDRVAGINTRQTVDTIRPWAPCHRGMGQGSTTPDIIYMSARSSHNHMVLTHRDIISLARSGTYGSHYAWRFVPMPAAWQPNWVCILWPDRDMT